MDKKEFKAIVLDSKYETFVIYITLLNFVALPSSSSLNIYLICWPQIAGLIAKKASIKVSAKYINFADVFFPDLASKLFEHIKINNHVIELVNGQQPLYKPIYSLKPVKLEILKAYIEIYLANRFIKLSKSSATTPILFDWKSNGSFQLCINDWDINNLTIKNRYPLPLIAESLDKWERARRFTQLDFTSIYHQMRICKGDE